MRLIITLIPLLFFVGCSTTTPTTSANQEGLKEISKVVLPTVQGQSRKLSDFRGKIVMLHFFSSWCVECGPEAQTMTNLYKGFDTSDFAVVGVAIDDDPFELQKFVAKNSVSFPVLMDTNQDFREFFQIREIPVTLLLDRTGKPIHFQDPDSGENSAKIVGARRWDTTRPVELIARLVEAR